MVRRIIVQVCAVICPFKENSEALMVRVANILDVIFFASARYVAENSVGPLPSVRVGGRMMNYHLATVRKKASGRQLGFFYADLLR